MTHYSKAVSSLRTSEIRDLMSLATRPDIISFAGGMPGNELFPVQEIDEIYTNLKGNKTLKTYKLAGHENYLLKYKDNWIKDITDFIMAK